MRRIRFLIWKELIELGRDPRLLWHRDRRADPAAVAARLRGDHRRPGCPGAIADADRSSASRDLVARFDASPTFTIVDVVSSPNEIDDYLDQGRAWLAVTIPRGLGEGMHGGAPQIVQMVADGSDANSAGVSLGYAQQPDRAATASRIVTREARPGTAALIDPRIRVWFNPQLESRYFMIPGRRRAPAAGRDDQPVVDGHRARKGDRHARAAERHAAHAGGS